MNKVRKLFKKKKLKKRPNKTAQKKMTEDEYKKQFIPPQPPKIKKTIDNTLHVDSIEIIDIPLKSPKKEQTLVKEYEYSYIKRGSMIIKVLKNPNQKLIEKKKIIPETIVEDELETIYTRVGKTMMFVRVKKKYSNNDDSDSD